MTNYQKHREYYSSYQRLRRARFKRKGLCVDCGRKARPGTTYCQKHFKQHVNYARERAAANRKKGLCQCGRPCVKGRSDCQYHLTYRRLNKGLSASQYQKALAATNTFDGRCPICGRPARKPCVDHKGKKFRGIICSRCNVGLGCARDSIKVLKAMISYLRRTR